jgi:hypothetical protein
MMIAQDTHGFISLGKRVMFFNTSRNLKTWWRSKQESPSKHHQGGEYRLGSFIKYWKHHGIIQKFAVPHTPQQNEVAERKKRTSMECARSMMKGKNLSNDFWAQAINIFVYLKNISPTRCLNHKTPFEALYDSKPTVNNLRIFWCKDFAHIPMENKKKLDAKDIKCIFIGYCS